MFQNVFPKKSFFTFIFFSLISISIVGCGGGEGTDDGNDANNQQSSAKAITAFSLNGITGTINEGAKTIAVTMPKGTNVTALVATFTATGSSVQVGATNQISSTTENDCTNPVVYTVSADDATTVNYTVTVTVIPTETDATNPTITITSPTTGSIVHGAVNVTASAVDNIAVTRVDFSVDGGAVTADTSAPYVNTLDTTTLSNGPHTINATAFDAAGNSATTSVTVTVNNTVADVTNPTVTITSPITGSTVSGEITITANAADNIAVSRVDFSIDGGAVTADNSAPYANTLDTTTLSNGPHTINATAFDGAGNSATTSVTVKVNNVVADVTNPNVNITFPLTGATVSGAITIMAEASDDIGVTRVDFSVDSGAVTADTSVPYTNTLDTTSLSNGFHTFEATAFDGAGNSASSSVTITISNGGSGTGTLPPDPKTVAPKLDPAVTTTMDAGTKFLYTGSNPIQTGVAVGTIKPLQVAVLRGNVAERDGAPLSGVTISILGHPEFGQTLSRADGVFDLAVNGGGKLTIKYEKTDFLPIQRKIDVPWQDYSWLPDIVMIALDPQVTTIDLTSSEPMQVAAGSEVTDADGARTAVVMIPQGTTATITLPDGSTQNLSTMSIRATEYTVGATGPAAMPGTLPPTTDYTYAVELSVDEAITSGVKVAGKDVVFNQPVSVYVDNFLTFPVGGIVPVGYYDNDKGAWIAYDNGLVIGIIGVTGALADVDVDGDGIADTGVSLSELNITVPEREQLALRYTAGDSLWRTQLRHFSTWDFNWNTAPPPDAQTPPDTDPSDPHKKPKDSDCENGSTIYCQSQVLGERIPLTGTSMGLNYRSDRAPAYLANYTVEIPITGIEGRLPRSINSTNQVEDIKLTIYIAGQRKTISGFPPVYNQNYVFTWDGKDGYGRPVEGGQRLIYTVEYRYAMNAFTTPVIAARTFARFNRENSEIGGNRTEGATFTTKYTNKTIFLGKNSVNSSLAGLSLDVHHSYDPIGSVLSMGTGSERSSNNAEIQRGVKTVDWKWNIFGNAASVKNMDFSADGSVYYSFGTYKIGKFDKDGVQSDLFGLGSELIADGLPAANVRNRSYIGDLIVADDGTIFFSLEYRAISGVSARHIEVWSIGTDGILNLVAGGATNLRPLVDDTSATDLFLKLNFSFGGLAFNPDGDLIIGFGRNIIKVADGVMTIVKIFSDFNMSIDSMAFDDEGRLYYSDGVRRVKRLNLDGTTETIAGTRTQGYSGDGGPAVDAELNFPGKITFGLDGVLYIAEYHHIRGVYPHGNIFTIVGDGSLLYSTSPPPPTEEYALLASAPLPSALTVHPDGRLFYTDHSPVGSQVHRTRYLAKLFPSYTDTEIAIASDDGNEIYYFSGRGRHLRTTSSLTKATLYSFSYDGDNQLISITDGDNKITTIERDSDGEPTAIVAPGGQRNLLTVNSNGYLQNVTNPAGETTTLSYYPAPVENPERGGLLHTFTDPKGNTSTMSYDAMGLLTRDENALGGFKDLVKEQFADGYKVTMTTAEGRTTSYDVQTLDTGEVRSIVTDRLGGQTIAQANGDGSTTTTYPNGMQVNKKFGPDPRFGLQVPVMEEMTLTLPSGLTKTVTQNRTATLSDPFDVTSLISMINTTTVDGRVAQNSFDATTNTYTKTSPLGRETTSVVDDQLRVVDLNFGAAVDPISMVYDELGLLSNISQGAQTRDYVYDTANRMDTQTDAVGNTASYTYDGADRVVALGLADGTVNGFAYDGNGNRTSYIMPSGSTHSVSFTEKNFKSSYIPPDNPGFTLSYNLDGQRMQKVLASGREIKNTFDGGGRWTNMSYPEAAVSFTYLDATTERISTLTRTPVGGGTAQLITHTYDGAYKTATGFSGIANADFNYTFNTRLFLSDITLVSGTDTIVTAQSHNNDGLLTNFGPFTFSRGGPGGSSDKISDPNLILNLTHDSHARVNGRSFGVKETDLYSLNLSRNSLGHIEQKTEAVNGVPHTYDYTYDSMGRLLEVKRDTIQVELYTYDENSNRLSTLTEAATYDNEDRIISQGGVAYNFDIDGFIKQRGGDSFRYSARGELLSVTPPVGPAVTYHYDGMSRRVGRTDASGIYEYFYGSPDNVLLITAYRSPNGVLTQLYYDDESLLFAFERAGAFFYVATDNVGSPKLISDANGTVLAEREYNSFGQLLSDSDPAFDLPIGFAGGLEDGVTGLVRFGFRDYDSAAGRWTARDPILFDGNQINLYVYAGNSPADFRDPSGLFTFSSNAYLGVGGGFEVSYKDGGFALCGEGGIGMGGGVGVSGGDLPAPGTTLDESISADCGPLGASIGASTPLGKCSNKRRTFQDQLDEITIEAHAGPLKVDNKNGFQLGGIGDSLLDFAADPKMKCGAGAKIAAKHCARF